MTMTLQASIQHLPDLVRRAFSAWYKTGGGYPLQDQPDQFRSKVETINGMDYVALRNASGITVAVYRVRRNGQLKRLVRIPANIAKENDLDR